jgi:acyl carrier protein
MTAELLEPVRLLVAEVMEVAPAEVDAESSNVSLERWDSLRHLKLVSALCDAFEIEIEDDEVEDCLTVAGILVLLTRKSALAA